MRNKYFRPRRSFDFSAHPYDLGILTGLKQGFEDNHFLSKLWSLPPQEYDAYYQRHLDYFLENHPGNAQEFFRYVWLIVRNRIKHYEDQDPHVSAHAKYMHRTERLRLFQHYLRSIDQWNTGKTKDEIIAAKEEEIKILNEQLAAMKQELKAARKLETEDYINIADGYRNTVLDLHLQLQEAKLPDGKELLLSQTQSVWMKMICKYFREGDREINFETIRRYFPGDKREPGDKHSPIPGKSKLFKVSPVKKRG